MAQDQNQNNAMLADACARNLQVEMHRRRSNGELLKFRGRLLRAGEDDDLEIELPQSESGEDLMHSGNVFTAYIVLDDCVYSFLCEIRETRVRADLNRTKRVEAIVVKRLSEVSSGQRRNAYRTPLAAVHEIEVLMHAAVALEEGYAAPVDSRVFRGELVEASAMGLGVIIDAQMVQGLRTNRLAYLQFSPPESDEPFTFLAEIRHCREVLDGTRSRLGIELVEWPDRLSFGREVNRLERFTTGVERARRKRQAG